MAKKCVFDVSDLTVDYENDADLLIEKNFIEFDEFHRKNVIECFFSFMAPKVHKAHLPAVKTQWPTNSCKET